MSDFGFLQLDLRRVIVTKWYLVKNVFLLDAMIDVGVMLNVT